MSWRDAVGKVAKGLVDDKHPQSKMNDQRTQQMARVSTASRKQRSLPTTAQSVKKTRDGRGSTGEIAKRAQAASGGLSASSKQATKAMAKDFFGKTSKAMGKKTSGYDGPKMPNMPGVDWGSMADLNKGNPLFQASTGMLGGMKGGRDFIMDHAPGAAVDSARISGQGMETGQDFVGDSIKDMALQFIDAIHYNRATEDPLVSWDRNGEADFHASGLEDPAKLIALTQGPAALGSAGKHGVKKIASAFGRKAAPAPRVFNPAQYNRPAGPETAIQSNPFGHGGWPSGTAMRPPQPAAAYRHIPEPYQGANDDYYNSISEPWMFGAE